MKGIIVGILLLVSLDVFSAAPSCHSNPTYCQYTGKVSKIYTNNAGQILIYFDTSLNIPDAEAVGLSPSNGGAAVYPVSENPDFARMLYSTALAAQASKRNITIMTPSTYIGYLKIDRIWLAE